MKTDHVFKGLLTSFFALFFSIGSYAQIWETHLDSALLEAKESGKPVLVNFSGSDWCRNCMKLDVSVFQDSLFTQFSDSSLVLLKVDFPRKKKNLPAEDIRLEREKLAEKWNPEGQFPKLLLIDATGKIIAVLPYPKNGPEDLIQTIESLI